MNPQHREQTCLRPFRSYDGGIGKINKRDALRRTYCQVSYNFTLCYHLSYFPLYIVTMKPSYARDSASLTLVEISVFDNTMPRGSLIFLVDSDLVTYQVSVVHLV